MPLHHKRLVKTEEQMIYDNDSPLPYVIQMREIYYGLKQSGKSSMCDERIISRCIIRLTRTTLVQKKILYDVLVKVSKAVALQKCMPILILPKKRPSGYFIFLVYSDTTDLGIEQLNAEGLLIRSIFVALPWMLPTFNSIEFENLVYRQTSGRN